MAYVGLDGGGLGGGLDDGNNQRINVWVTSGFLTKLIWVGFSWGCV